MSGPPPEGGSQVVVTEWVRDGALGGIGSNMAAVAAVLALGVVFDGVGTLEHVLTDPTFFGALAVLSAAGAVFGALAGAGGAALWGVASERWFLLLPCGFPAGFAAGVAETYLLELLVFPGMQDRVPLVGGAGGALALGLGWPLYLVLRVGGRPGLAAVAIVPVLAIGAALAPLSILVWWDRS